MDPLALAAGNLLLGNDDGAAAIEVPVFPFQVRFSEDCAFALTGADCAAPAGRRSRCCPGGRSQARAGQVLTLGLPQAGRCARSRAYLCLRGRRRRARGARLAQHAVARRLRRPSKAARCARATCCAPRTLTAQQCRTGFGLVPPALALPLQVDGVRRDARAAGGRIHGYYDRRRARRSGRGEWKITAQSDRYGYRLAGDALRARRADGDALARHRARRDPGAARAASRSCQMRDAQPSGGYPKFGTVIEADLWRLGPGARSAAACASSKPPGTRPSPRSTQTAALAGRSAARMVGAAPRASRTREQ